MLQQSQNFGYGARVYQAPELDPNSENGPIRRASGALVPNNTEPPRMVYRTPHAVVPDAESGAVYEDPPVWQDKFLPDGRLVPMHALAGFGADAATPLTPEKRFAVVATTTLAIVLATTGVVALALTLRK